jgi:S1-C subfamily serine protease
VWDNSGTVVTNYHVVENAREVQVTVGGSTYRATVINGSPNHDLALLKLQGEAASRLLLTPHVAGVTRQSAAFLFKASWENVQNVLNGGTLAHRVY